MLLHNVPCLLVLRPLHLLELQEWGLRRVWFSCTIRLAPGLEGHTPIQQAINTAFEYHKTVIEIFCVRHG